MASVDVRDLRALRAALAGRTGTRILGGEERA